MAWFSVVWPFYGSNVSSVNVTTFAMNRKPRRGIVRSMICAFPLSPIARRSALIRDEIAAFDTIRTRPGGSIDTAYYMAIGRNCRAEQAAKLTRKLFRRKGAKRL